MSDYKPPVHIHIDLGPGQILNEEIGWLSLPSSGTIKVSVKEYTDIKNRLVHEDSVLKTKSNKISAELEKNLKLEKSYANDRAHEGGKWEELVPYEGRMVMRTLTVQYKEQAKLNKVAKKQQDEIKKRRTEIETELAELKEKYASIRWVWVLVGSSRPKLTKENFHSSYVQNPQEITLTFNDFLVGGGAAYLEPFWEGTEPKGKYPYGVLVNSQGEKTDIIHADWRDADDNLITDTLKFGSTAYLNIYTEGLYGHNIDIQLMDKDKVIRALTFNRLNGDDKLFVREYLDNGIEVEKRQEKDIRKKEEKLTRAVNIHTTTNFPEIAKRGFLLDDNHNGEKPVQRPNVQKCKFAVYIDPFWEMDGGYQLEVYPIAYSPKLPNGEVKLENAILKINDKNGKLLEVEKITSNQVAVISGTETNMAFFHHCGYSIINALYKNEVTTIFEKKTAEVQKQTYLEIKATDKEEELYIYLPDLETEECRYNNIDGYHTDHFVKIEQPEHFKNLEIKDKYVKFDVKYPKPTQEDLAANATMQKLKPIEYNLNFETCRFKHPLKIDVYPSVEYTFNAHLGVGILEYLYVTQTNNYRERIYDAEDGSRSNNAKEVYNKNKTEKYKNTDDQVTKNNFLKKYKFSVAFEGKFAGEQSISLKSNIASLEQIIEKIIYVYSIIDSYLGGSALKEAEEDPEKKQLFESSQSQRKFKKGNLPVRFEITPPKFTGGVSWKYLESQKHPNQIGVEYAFKLGALPLIGLAGRLDLLFAAQFIPYLGAVVKALDRSVKAIANVGEAMQYFGLGNMSADYYFDLVASTRLNIDVTRGAKYHTIDGFTSGNLSVFSDLEISLRAGGYLKVEVFSIKGEAIINAETTAKFKLEWKSEKKDQCTFSFDGVEATIFALIKMGRKSESGINDLDLTIETKEQQTTKFDTVTIFKPFSIDIELPK